MYNNKYLLFTNGGGSSDPLNWSKDEAALYSVNNLESIKPSSSQTIDIVFDTNNGKETVTLKVKNGSHVRVITAIASAISNSKSSIISIADVDNRNFIHRDIFGVTIGRILSTQKLSGTGQAKINLDLTPTSMTLSNTQSGGAEIDLYLVDKTGSDLVDTAINAAENQAASGSSVTLIVDGTVPTNDLVLNERIYKSDGTFFGLATSWADSVNDTITFSGGLENAIANNDDLYRGTRYYILHTLSIPLGSTLTLESDDINFPMEKYDLYAKLDSGAVEVITRY